MCSTRLWKSKCALLLLALVSHYDKKSSLYGYGTGKTSTVAGTNNVYAAIAAYRYCSYTGKQRQGSNTLTVDRPLPSSTLEPKAPLFIIINNNSRVEIIRGIAPVRPGPSYGYLSPARRARNRLCRYCIV